MASFVRRRTTVATILAFVGLINSCISGLEQCTVEQGGGVCPDGNTCCALDDFGGSGCISGGMGTHSATCCSDGRTGCPKGYRCEADGTCRATPSRRDPLLQVLPRYTLCRPSSTALTQVHGLPIVGDESDAMLPYYSSHGSITENVPYKSQIEMALVIIHGGGRNADDYFCPAMASVALQEQYQSSNVLLLAPRFVTAADTKLNLHNGGTAMKWGGIGHGKWRFGATAEYPAISKNVTSFDAIDILMNTLGDRDNFPNIKQIVIAGHSVGGQFIQRWSLLTSSWMEDRMRAVIMNPSSWTYLTPMRFLNGTWQIPSSCPRYNTWTWGLEKPQGLAMHSPYKDRVLERLGIERVVKRFANRHMTYLAGSADRCNVTGKNQWCQSHDLGIECMDELQGSSRWDRHVHYVESLELVGIESHENFVVEGVGHDHAAMFTSPVAVSVLFPTKEAVIIGDDGLWQWGILSHLVYFASAPLFHAVQIASTLYQFCVFKL